MIRSNQIRQANGFTIIELLLAITIVAILLALAVPAYQNHTIRTKVTECINGGAVAKLAISEYRQSLGAWPPSLEGAGLNKAGISQFCLTITSYDSSVGSFAVDVNEAAVGVIAGTKLQPTMTPFVVPPSGFINWDCENGVPETSVENLVYLPASCRDG